MTENQELQTELTINDLKIIANLIELSTSKGLFKANDLTVVGRVFDKIVSVLKSVKNEN